MNWDDDMIDLKRVPYHSEDFIQDAQKLEKDYKGFINYVTIGRSNDGRDIILLKIGLGSKYLLSCSGVHGRESINPIVLMKIIDYYAYCYASYHANRNRLKYQLKSNSKDLNREYEKMIFSSFVYEMLQKYTILFVPMLNPDGYDIALYGFESIRDKALQEKCRSKEIPFSEWKFNANAVDINRNFPSKYWKKEDGEKEESLEPETQAFMSLCKEYQVKGMIDFHSRGNCIYYYRNAMPERYNKNQLRIAKSLRKYTGYELVQPNFEVEEKDSGGNTVHYASEFFQIPAFTIETVADEAIFPLDVKYREQVYNELKHVLIGFGNLLL